MSAITQEIRLTGLEAELQAQTGRRSLGSAGLAVLWRWAGEVLEFITQRWPVDTGNSRDAWEVEPLTDGVGLLVTNGMEYVSHVHEAGDDIELWPQLLAQLEQTLPPAVAPELRPLFARPRPRTLHDMLRGA